MMMREALFLGSSKELQRESEKERNGSLESRPVTHLKDRAVGAPNQVHHQLGQHSHVKREAQAIRVTPSPGRERSKRLAPGAIPGQSRIHHGIGPGMTRLAGRTTGQTPSQRHQASKDSTHCSPFSYFCHFCASLCSYATPEP